MDAITFSFQIGMSNLYVATTHRSSAVSSALVASFTAPNESNLIVTRGNVIDVLVMSPEGLQTLSSISIFGNIVKLDKYRSNACGTDSLFVLTGKHQFIILVWEVSSIVGGGKIIVKATGNLNDSSSGIILGKESENGPMVFVDPESRMIGVLVHEGQIKVWLSILSLFQIIL